jgi:hypothetical protein
MWHTMFDEVNDRSTLKAGRFARYQKISSLGIALRTSLEWPLSRSDLVLWPGSVVAGIRSERQLSEDELYRRGRSATLGADTLSQDDRPVIARRKAATWSNAKRAIATS